MKILDNSNSAYRFCVYVESCVWMYKTVEYENSKGTKLNVSFTIWTFWLCTINIICSFFLFSFKNNGTCAMFEQKNLFRDWISLFRSKTFCFHKNYLLVDGTNEEKNAVSGISYWMGGGTGNASFDWITVPYGRLRFCKIWKPIGCLKIN